MKPMLRRDIHPKATVPDDSQGPIIEFRSSDETLDRYNERITVSGWKLDNYRKNPVVQNAHNYASVSDTIAVVGEGCTVNRPVCAMMRSET